MERRKQDWLRYHYRRLRLLSESLDFERLLLLLPRDEDEEDLFREDDEELLALELRLSLPRLLRGLLAFDEEEDLWREEDELERELLLGFLWLLLEDADDEGRDDREEEALLERCLDDDDFLEDEAEGLRELLLLELALLEGRDLELLLLDLALLLGRLLELLLADDEDGRVDVRLATARERLSLEDDDERLRALLLCALGLVGCERERDTTADDDDGREEDRLAVAFVLLLDELPRELLLLPLCPRGFVGCDFERDATADDRLEEEELEGLAWELLRERSFDDERFVDA